MALKKLGDNPPLFTNAHLNRNQAMRLINAGFSPREVAKAFPRVWSCNVEGKLGQKYDGVYSNGLKETRYTILSEIVDKMVDKRKVKG